MEMSNEKKIFEILRSLFKIENSFHLNLVEPRTLRFWAAHHPRGISQGWAWQGTQMEEDRRERREDPKMAWLEDIFQDVVISFR